MEILKNDRFINYEDATICNMSTFMEGIQEEYNVKNICEDYGLNYNILREFFKLKARGLNNVQVASTLKVHRVTIQRYTNALQSMDDSEFQVLYSHVLNLKNEEEYN